MNRNTLFSILATAALGIVMAGPVSAKTTRWTSGDATNPAKWHEANNWNNGIPVAGDTVNIQPLSQPDGYQDPVLSTADGAAGDLTLGNGFTLTITGRTLTLDLAVTHDIDGEIRLSADASVLKITGDDATLDIAGAIILQADGAVLDLDADVTVQGAGEIKGEDNAAKIQIKGGTTLTSTMLIQGHMVIETNGGSGAGKLDNRGLVYANGDGTLALGENLLLDDTGSAVRWKVGNVGGAILEFRNEHIDSSKLDGDFAVANCSKLKFEKTIETNGDFDTGAAAGFVDVDAANSVEFRYDCVGGCTVIDSDETYGGC